MSTAVRRIGASTYSGTNPHLLLHEAIKTLPQNPKEVIVMHYLMDKSVAQVLALALCGLAALGAATSLAVIRLRSPASAAPEQKAYNSKGSTAVKKFGHTR